MKIFFASHFKSGLSFNVAKAKQLRDRNRKLMGKDSPTDRKEAESEMLRLSKPKIWNVHLKNNAELEMTTGFEAYLFLIAEHTNVDLEKISLFRFHSLVDYIKSKNKNG